MPEEEIVDTPELASKELKAYLQGVYPDYEIKLEEDEEGNYVYTANGVELATVAKDDVVDVYTNLSGNSLEAPDKEVDVNKMNTPSAGKRRNYGAKNVINIDVDLFNGILSNINEGSSILNDVNDLDTSPLTGELQSYFIAAVSTFGDFNTILKSERTNASELSFKVDASIKAYQEIDEDLKFGLNTVFANIFSMTSDDIATYNMSLEERETYIDGLIDTYTEILTEFKEDYQELMGTGAELDPEVFDVWSSMINYFPVLDLTNGASDRKADLYLPNGNVNLIQLSFYDDAWKNSGIKEKLTAYIRDGKSWEESGLAEYDNIPMSIPRSESGFLKHIANCVVDNDSFWDYVTENEDISLATSSIIALKEGKPEDKSILLRYIEKSGILEYETQYQETLNKKNQLETDIFTLENTIYNYKQYRGLMPYEEYSKDPRFTLYLAGDMSFALTDPNLKNGELYNYMDASEVALYKLILDTKGESEAKGYLNALTDTINQRKGFEVAANFCQNMNQNGGDVLDWLYSGAVGMGDGVETFFAGLGNFFGGADGIRSVQDYEHMYKVYLLNSNNDYTSNLSDEYRSALKFQYQAFNSIGNNAIPMLISFVPIPGAKALGSSLMFAAAAGNSTEEALQEGYSRGQAYLYGTLSGASEVLLEKVLGHLPGIGKSSAAMGTETLLQSMFGEAKEEIVQTYLDGAFRSTILGEPFDLTNLTGEALQAGLTAMYCAGVSNVGGKCLVKLGDVVINLNNKEDHIVFQEWLSEKQRMPDSVLNLIPESIRTKFGIELTTSTATPGLDPSNPIAQSVQFDPDTNSYIITLQDGTTYRTTSLNEDAIATMNPYLMREGFDFTDATIGWGMDDVNTGDPFLDRIIRIKRFGENPLQYLTQADLMQMRAVTGKGLNVSDFDVLLEYINRYCANEDVRMRSEFLGSHFDPSTNVYYNFFGTDSAYLNAKGNEISQIFQRYINPKLYSLVNSITINDRTNPADLLWEFRYNYKKRFTSAATGGMGTINFFRADQNPSYLKTIYTLYHEIGHNLDNRCGSVASSQAWLNIMAMDQQTSGQFSVTGYGQNCYDTTHTGVEDFAESLSGLFDDPITFSRRFPNRTNFLLKVSGLTLDEVIQTNNQMYGRTQNQTVPTNKTQNGKSDVDAKSDLESTLDLDKTLDPDKTLDLDKTQDPDKTLDLDKTLDPDKTLETDKPDLEYQAYLRLKEKIANEETMGSSEISEYQRLRGIYGGK